MTNEVRAMLLMVLILVEGCMGGAQLVLKSPVQSKCEEMKLRGCEQLAEGIVLYVDGDKTRGYSALRAGLARNTGDPLKLKALATGLKLLQKAPGVGSYVAAMRPVIELIDDTANQALLERKDREEEGDEVEAKAEAKGAPRAPAAPSSGAEPSEGPQARSRRGGRSMVGSVRTGTVLPGRDAAEPCNLLGGRPGATQAQCSLVVTGPFLLTDLHGAGCPQDLVVLAGDPEQPAWFILISAGKQAALHGSRLAVGKELPLTVAYLPATATPLPTQCAVTWSGTRE